MIEEEKHMSVHAVSHAHTPTVHTSPPPKAAAQTQAPPAPKTQDTNHKVNIKA